LVYKIKRKDERKDDNREEFVQKQGGVIQHAMILSVRLGAERAETVSSSFMLCGVRAQ
jgi:hypothetical protein